MSWVPIVDIGERNAVHAIAEACQRTGFLTIVGHEVPTTVLDDTWNAARDFFDQTLAEKMLVAMPRPGYPYGYSPLAGETLARSLGNGAPPDLKESYAIGPVDRPTHTITDPDESFAWSENLWPPALPHFRLAWERHFREMAELSQRLLRLMAVGLGTPAHHFDALISRPTSAMRALNYPARASATDVATDQFGASAHTDYGTLTILLADPVQGGLQVQDSTGEWHDVDTVPGSLVVNLGDAMARWTNDRWRSTMHRVLVPEGRRQSIAFFHNANWDAVIECLPTCLEPGELPRYQPIAAGPHLMQKFQSTVNTFGGPMNEAMPLGPAMPPGLSLVRVTPEFTATTVPAGLLRAHEVAEGVWGRLKVHHGHVGFVFEDEPNCRVEAVPGEHVDIPPGRPHHVEPDDDAVFVVEFHR